MHVTLVLICSPYAQPTLYHSGSMHLTLQYQYVQPMPNQLFKLWVYASNPGIHVLTLCPANSVELYLYTPT